MDSYYIYIHSLLCISISICVCLYGGLLKWGYLNSWMVYLLENPTKMDENWRYPYFRKPPTL